MNRYSVPLLAGTCALACVALPAVVRAQPADSTADASPPTVQQSAASQGALQEITITGFKRAYETALQTKRLDLGISDGISSFGIGNFPDLNVGEALQRIPGVQINREAGSRDATIDLRGLPGTYAQMTLNGVKFADAQLDGSSPLGVFEADVFSAFVVKKTPDAADQPGGLTGNIDLQIAHALDRKDNGLSVSAGSNYEETTSKFNPEAFASFSKHFLDNRIGVFASGGWSDQNFRRDSISVNAYNPLSKTTTPNYSALYGTKTVYFPADDRQFSEHSIGHRTSIAAGAEFKPDDHWDTNLIDLFTDRNYGDSSTTLQELDLRGGNTVITPAGPAFQLPDGNTYINRFSFTNPQVNSSYRTEPYVISSNTVIGTVGYTNKRYRSLTTLTYSDSKDNASQAQVDWRKLPLASPGNGISGSLYSGGSDIGNYLMTLSPSPVATFTPGPFKQVNAYEAANSSGDHLVVAGTDELDRNTISSAQQDFEIFFNNPVVESFQFGVRYEDNKFTSGEGRSTIYGIQSQNVTNGSFIVPAYIPGFFGGGASGYNTNWQTINYPAVVAMLQPVTVGPGQALTGEGWVNNIQDGGVGALNFAITNRIYSGYGMAKLDTTVLGFPLRGAAGARYEYTQQTTDSSQYDAHSNLELTHDTHDYGEVLPSLLLDTSLTDKLLVRFAYYKSFVRAQPRQISPSTVVSGAGNTYSVTLGSPDLQPFTADSFDLSLEYYNRPGGLLSLAFFTKKVKGVIAPETNLSRLCPANGGGYGLGTLNVIGGTCYATATYNNAPIQVNVQGSVNSDSPLTVDGVEASVQQNLDFLPGFLRNLGGILNYSYTNLSGTDSLGHPLTLPGVSRHAANAILYYEGNVLGVRLAYNYRSWYNLEQGNTFLGAADQVKARGQLDASANWNLTDNVTLIANMFNLTNALRVEYQNSPWMPRRVDYDGRTYELSVRVSL